MSKDKEEVGLFPPDRRRSETMGDVKQMGWLTVPVYNRPDGFGLQKLWVGQITNCQFLNGEIVCGIITPLTPYVATLGKVSDESDES